MISVILIDDEKPALRELKFFLDAYSDVSILGMYKNPLEAIAIIEEQKPDVVFLDINMPKLMGIDAASKILDVSPSTDIVFITAYDKYAVEAFELHALDYVLKPIAIGRFKKTMQRILEKKNAGDESPKGRDHEKLNINFFGKLKIGWEGQEPIKWRTEKTGELFAYLICNSGRNISKEEMTDKIWPDKELDKVMKQLYNGIYFIRKALTEYGVDRTLIRINSSYNVRLGKVNWDYQRFNELSKKLNELDVADLLEMEALYAGELLEGELYAWVELEREKAMKKYEQCVKRLTDLLMQEGQTDEIETLLLKAFNKAPLNENFTELLLKLYKHTGNRYDALKHYNIYTKLLKQELDAEPDFKLKGLLE